MNALPDDSTRIRGDASCRLADNHPVWTVLDRVLETGVNLLELLGFMRGTSHLEIMPKGVTNHPALIVGFTAQYRLISFTFSSAWPRLGCSSLLYCADLCIVCHAIYCTFLAWAPVGPGIPAHFNSFPLTIVTWAKPSAVLADLQCNHTHSEDSLPRDRVPDQSVTAFLYSRFKVSRWCLHWSCLSSLCSWKSSEPRRMVSTVFIHM